jgi:Domain of unknown function (DUF4136)
MKRVRNAILAISCCSACFSALALSQKVEYRYDRALNFSNFRTYRWVTIEGSTGISHITADKIMDLVNAQLAHKGMTQVTGNQRPDLYVGYQTSVDQQRHLKWFNSGGPWMGGGQSGSSTIDAGTLVVDFYNPAQKQLVWRGSVTHTLNPSSNADKNYSNLQKAVGKLLKAFPPQASR